MVMEEFVYGLFNFGKAGDFSGLYYIEVRVNVYSYNAGPDMDNGTDQHCGPEEDKNNILLLQW